MQIGPVFSRLELVDLGDQLWYHEARIRLKQPYIIFAWHEDPVVFALKRYKCVMVVFDTSDTFIV